VLTVEKCDCPEGYTGKYSKKRSTVKDSWHFGPDPDPRIRTTDFRIRTPDPSDKVPTRNKFSKSFVFACYGTFEGTFTSVFIDKSQKRSHRKVEIRFFPTFLLINGRIRIRIRIRAGRPKNIRIHNTEQSITQNRYHGPGHAVV
jgi:hypothetical protein